MPNPSLDAASAAQRTAFVDDAADAALETPDVPRTPEGVERAWSAANREGRADVSGKSTLTIWNFDVASAALKPAHDIALARFLAIDTLGVSATRFRVIGGASRTGSEQRNITIAGRRAEAVAWLFSSRFAIRQIRIVTDVTVAKVGGGAEDGERFAYDRRVTIERITPPVARDEEPGVPELPKAPAIPEKSHGVPVVVQKVEFPLRIPVSGVLPGPGGWVTFYVEGTFVGEARSVAAGSPDSIGVSLVMTPLPKIKAEGRVKLADGLKLKLGIDFGKPSATGAPLSATGQFEELGGIENIELGANFKDLRAPLLASKTWKVLAYPLVIDGQTINLVGTVKATIGFGVGPTLLARAGPWVSRVVSGALVPEAAGATVGTAAAAPVIGGIIAVPILFVAVAAGSAQTMKFANDEGDRRARLVARRLGFSLTIAAEALRPVSRPEVDRYVNGVDLEYARLGAVLAAYNSGKAEALKQVLRKDNAGQRAFRAAIRAAFGNDIEKAHRAIFQKFGGLQKGDESARLDLGDIPVQQEANP